MSLTKAKDPQYPHFQDYRLFRSFMRKETYWAHLYGEAVLLIEKIQVEGPQLPDSFDEFYKINLKNHVLQVILYKSWLMCWGLLMHTYMVDLYKHDAGFCVSYG